MAFALELIAFLIARIQLFKRKGCFSRAMNIYHSGIQSVSITMAVG